MANKHTLKGLKAEDYEHDFDKKSLKTVKSTPGIDHLGRFINRHAIEPIYSVQYTGSNIRVTKEAYPDLYAKFENACDILDLNKIPDLYIEWGYDINACTIGSEKPIVILNSGTIDLCDEDEMLFVIGHELGHIKSNHMLYQMMGQVINIAIDSIPFGNIAGAPLQYALYYWHRMSEFTADRAGLLCCQNVDAAISAFMKIAGMPISQFCNIKKEAFIHQATEFKQMDYDALSKVVKYVSIMDSSHPWTVMRAAELLKWVRNNKYSNIINNKQL